MSDIFESDIDDEENLSNLEDNDIKVSESENLVFDYPLYLLKLELLPLNVKKHIKNSIMHLMVFS